MIYIMLFEILIGVIYLLLFCFVDRIVTNKRLKENQSEWDNYCKDMTYSERLDCFTDWLLQRQCEKGWRFKYIPYINHVKTTVFDCEIDGVQHRGTKEDIASSSGIPIEILNRMGTLPQQIETGRRCLNEFQRIEIET